MSKVAHVYSVNIPEARRYAWKWRSADGKRESADLFVYFYDCVEDGRRHGYEIELKTAFGDHIPGAQPSSEQNGMHKARSTNGGASLRQG